MVGGFAGHLQTPKPAAADTKVEPPGFVRTPPKSATLALFKPLAPLEAFVSEAMRMPSPRPQR